MYLVLIFCHNIFINVLVDYKHIVSPLIREIVAFEEERFLNRRGCDVDNAKAVAFFVCLLLFGMMNISMSNLNSNEKILNKLEK
jgi:hypothetical protein